MNDFWSAATCRRFESSPRRIRPNGGRGRVRALQTYTMN